MRRPWLAVVRGPFLALVSVVSSSVLLALCLVTLALIPVGVGVLATGPVQSLLRGYANWRRGLAGRWGGVVIPEPYRPPRRRHTGVAGQFERCALLLRDPATWRDQLWLLIDITGGFVSALVPPLLPVNFQLAKALLEPSRQAVLEKRVERLHETRHDAVDGSAAELRRIERDLHDGAQARLVAMGMSLGTIEALVEKDPAKAKQLLAQARESSAEALTELRDLVRGIHPPVLAERGLPDALRALALRAQLPVEVDVELPGRYEEPVETAAYFAISELLTNAAKHAQADTVWIDVHSAGTPEGEMLRIAVTDDGRGGADIAGSGMAGIDRRLGQFDGVLAVSSPAGGPTMVTMEIPATALPETSAAQ